MPEETFVPPMALRKSTAGVQRARRSPALDEIGVTGLRQYGGFVVEEWLRQLSGKKAAWVYREMADNDGTVGAFLFAIEMLARGVPWEVEEGKEAGASEFIEECMDDMSSPWLDVVCEILSMLIFGWSLHEEVFKKRNGPQTDTPIIDGERKAAAPASSRFTDGKIGWRKLPIRAQETLWNWEFDESGGVQAMNQIGWDGQKRTIPIQKALLFRTRSAKGNPEGRSILRNAYVAWFRKKTIEEIEAIGVERDLAGIPVAKPPAEGGSIYGEDEQSKKILAVAEEMVSTIRRDEDEGVVLPPGWELELLTTGGSRQLDTNEIIRRYQQVIATSVLADLLLIGQDKVGSYAMVDAKADIFGAAVDTWMEAIAEVFNRYAIPRLLALNGMSLEGPPQLRPGTVRRIDLDALAQLLERLTAAGAVVFPDNDLLASIFQRAGLPAPAAVEAEKADTSDPVSLRLAEVQTPKLGKRYLDIASHHERHLQLSMNSALRDFGEEAANAYERIVTKAASVTPEERAAADQVMQDIGAAQFARKLARAYHGHYGAVADSMIQAFKEELGVLGRSVDINLTREARADILREGGLRVGMLDIEKQLRGSIFKALADAREAGEGWKEAAERIRRYVPSGRFVKAGAEYRAQMIARSETANAQRMISLEAYKAHPEVVKVELLDGLLASSDAECIARNGDVVGFAEAESIASDEHPLGTLQLLPSFR
jgi:hypothetical protein